MSLVRWRVVRIPFVNNSYNLASSTIIERFFDPVVTTNTGSGRDSFSFKINNFNNELDLLWNNNDRVLIYRTVNNNVFTDSDLLMTGVLRKIPETVSYNQDMQRFEGYNYSETLMDAICFIDAQNLTTDSTLQNAINSVANFNQNFKVTWNSSNPSTTSIGGSFPIVNQRFYNKPLKDVIEKLSKESYTNDGLYYWFVDVNNTLVWRKRDNVISGSFNVNADDFISMSVDKDTNDVKNYAIIQGGTDPKGNPLQTFYADFSSINKHGYKYYFMTDDNALAKSNFTADLALANTDSLSGISFPFIPSWTSESFANESAYVAGFRDYHKAQLKILGQDAIKNLSKGKVKVSIVRRPSSSSWGLGQVIACTIPSVSVGVKNLRVEEVQFTTTADTFSLVEDIGSL